MTSRPNVLIVMSDEQSWDTLGCNGNRAARSPNVDALAGTATSFDHCYTAFPLCCPARTSLWTGLMPRHHGVLGNWRPIEPHLREAGLARAFSEGGYHTIYCGKWHVPGTTPRAMGWADASAIPEVLDGRDRGRYIQAYRDHLVARGYQLDSKSLENLTVAEARALAVKPYATAEVAIEDQLEVWQTQRFLEALDRRPRDRSWLAVCSFNAPHFPLVVPAPYDRCIDRGAIELPPSWATGTCTTPREVRESHYARDFENLTQEDWVEAVAHYLGLCAIVDEQVGRVLAYLREQGEWERTVVVFTSDHGDLMGAHRLMEKGHQMHYEEDLRIPLLVRVPGGRAGRVDGLVSICDLAPSLMELAGVPGRAAIDGCSFAGLVDGTSTPSTRPHVIAESYLADGHPGGQGDPFRAADFTFPRDSVNLSIRTPRVRYVFRSHDEDELYDLPADPYEQVNQAAAPAFARVRAECRRALAEEIEDAFPSIAAALRGDQQPDAPR